MKQLVS